MQTVPPPVKKLILRNIQSLPKAEIELGPPGTMTTVIGESDTGKTALASRAIEKLFFNTIPTKELIRRGAKSASITAVYDTPDNLSVSWEWKGTSPDRGKSRYVIKRDNMDPIILEGSNRPGNVPEAIQELTGVRPVKIGNLIINFNVNRQLDGPFLGASVSSTERYRVLGALAGTLEVDEAVKEVGLEIHRARRKEKELSGEIDSLGEKIREYDYLVELKDVIEKVETGLMSIRRKMGHRDKLIALQIEIEAKLELVKDAGNKATALGRMIEQANQELNHVETNISRHQKLLEIQHQIINIHFTLDKAKQILKKTENHAKAYLHTNATEEQNNKLTTLTKLRQAIATEHQKLTATQRILDTTRNTEQAQIAVERLGKANYTLGRLVSLYAEITKTTECIKRNTATLEVTAGVERGQQVLGRVVGTADKLSRLANLLMLVNEARNRVEAAERALEATDSVVQGLELLSRVRDNESRYHALLVLGYQCRQKEQEVNELKRNIEIIDQQIKAAREEYRALLLEAGICEHCKVVDAVMAAS